MLIDVILNEYLKLNGENINLHKIQESMKKIKEIENDTNSHFEIWKK